MKISALAYTRILGLPLVAWGGLITFALIALTFSIGYLNHRGKHIIPFKYHKPVATMALLAVIIHGTIGLLSYLGF